MFANEYVEEDSRKMLQIKEQYKGKLATVLGLNSWKIYKMGLRKLLLS